MSEFKRWRVRPDRSTGNNSDQWSFRWIVGRVQIGCTVFQHHYPVHPDRWVVQPSFVYDRKEHHDRTES